MAVTAETESLKSTTRVIACLGTGFNPEPQRYSLKDQFGNIHEISLSVNIQGVVRGLAAIIEDGMQTKSSPIVLLGGNKDQNGIPFSIVLQNELEQLCEILGIQPPIFVTEERSLTTRQNAIEAGIVEKHMRDESDYPQLVPVDIVTSESHNFGNRVEGDFNRFIKPGETVELLTTGRLITVEDIFERAKANDKWSDIIQRLDTLFQDYQIVENSPSNTRYKYISALLYRLPFGNDFMRWKATRDRVVK